jgi:O-antigen/teichoic acid export membrane protein
VVASRVVTTLLDVATGIVIVKALTQAEVGIVAFLLGVYEVTRYLTTLGFPDSVFYFFERIAPGARRAFTWHTCRRLAALALVAALLIVLPIPFLPALLSAWTPDQVAAAQRFLPLIAFVGLLEIPTWPTTNVLLALDRPRDAGLYEVVTSLMTFGLLLGPILAGYPVEVALYGLAAYAVLRLVLSFAWLHRVLPPATAALPAGIGRQQTRFSLPLGLNLAVSRLNRRAAYFIVAALLPAAALAEFQVAAQEIPAVTVVSLAVGSVLISRYVAYELEGRRDELIALWYRAIERTTLVVVPVTVAGIALAPDFVLLVSKAEYASAVVPFQIFNLVVLHRVTSYGAILQAFGDTRGLLRVTLVLLAANVALSLPLTYAFGITGTVVGGVLANALAWTQMLRRIGRHLKLPAWRVLPFPYYLRVLAVAGACGLVTAGLRALVALPPWAGLPGGLAVFFALFGLTGTLAGVITRADWNRLLRRR